MVGQWVDTTTHAKRERERERERDTNIERELHGMVARRLRHPRQAVIRSLHLPGWKGGYLFHYILTPRPLWGRHSHPLDIAISFLVLYPGKILLF